VSVFRADGLQAIERRSAVAASLRRPEHFTIETRSLLASPWLHWSGQERSSRETLRLTTGSVLSACPRHICGPAFLLTSGWCPVQARGFRNVLAGLVVAGLALVAKLRESSLVRWRWLLHRASRENESKKKRKYDRSAAKIHASIYLSAQRSLTRKRKRGGISAGA
jgi:hypothetical protein